MDTFETWRRWSSSRKFPAARYPSFWLPVVTLLLDLQPVPGPRTFRDGGKSSAVRGNPKLLGLLHSFVAAASCCIRADRYSRGASE